MCGRVTESLFALDRGKVDDLLGSSLAPQPRLRIGDGRRKAHAKGTRLGPIRVDLQAGADLHAVDSAARDACRSGGQGDSVLDEVLKDLTLVFIFIREVG